MHNSFLLSTFFFFPPNAPKCIRSGSSNGRMGTQEAEGRKKQPRYKLTSLCPAPAHHSSPQLTSCPIRCLSRREAIIKFEPPTSSQFAGGTEKTCGLKVCAMSMLLPTLGGNQAEDGLAVVQQLLK